MARDLTLSIDVGTGSVRAALVERAGQDPPDRRREHDQIVPAFGWSEQRPRDWWAGVVASDPRDRARPSRGRAADRRRLRLRPDARHRARRRDGRLTRETVPLWNDKRTIDLVADFEAPIAPATYLAESGNPPTPAWPGFKLAGCATTIPTPIGAAAGVLMPKDYINFRLTGEIAMDTGDASCSFLMNPRAAPMVHGDGRAPRPRYRQAADDPRARWRSSARSPPGPRARRGSRRARRFWSAAADYPVALLGSGVCRPGLGFGRDRHVLRSSR